jgi:pseudouridine synthase
MRINKYLAECGLGSRRGVEQLIKDNKVKVNKKPVTSLSTDINVENDTVTVDDKAVEPVNSFTYIMFYKPKGCICSASDEKGRKTIYDYIDIDKRIFNVGRLDYDTEGLLLMTNDGDLSNKLTHPSSEIPKTYLVKVEGQVDEPDLALLRKGVMIDGVKTHGAKIKLKEFKDNISSYLVTIYEGKNREIHKMFETIGKEVIFIKRIAIGDLKLGGLARGAYRYLNENEIFYLKNI